MALDPTTKTALDIITGALRKTGQYAPGEPITAADANDALDVFNGLLDILSNEDLQIYSRNENVATLTANKQSYTVGTGADISIQRPLRIVKAYSRLTTTGSAVDFPCEIIDLDKYGSIGLKSRPGPWAKMLFYNPTTPNGVLYLWPIPTQTVEFHFWTDMLFQAEALTSTASLPQGFYLFLQYALAEALCVEYGIAVPPDVRRLAERYKRAIKSNNATVDRLASIDGGLAVRNSNDAGWYLTGGF